MLPEKEKKKEKQETEEKRLKKKNRQTYRPSHYSAQWVPGPLVKPVEKLVKAISCEMMS